MDPAPVKKNKRKPRPRPLLNVDVGPTVDIGDKKKTMEKPSVVVQVPASAAPTVVPKTKGRRKPLRVLSVGPVVEEPVHDTGTTVRTMGLAVKPSSAAGEAVHPSPTSLVEIEDLPPSLCEKELNRLEEQFDFLVEEYRADRFGSRGRAIPGEMIINIWKRLRTMIRLSFQGLEQYSHTDRDGGSGAGRAYVHSLEEDEARIVKELSKGKFNRVDLMEMTDGSFRVLRRGKGLLGELCQHLGITDFWHPTKGKTVEGMKSLKLKVPSLIALDEMLLRVRFPAWGVVGAGPAAYRELDTTLLPGNLVQIYTHDFMEFNGSLVMEGEMKVDDEAAAKPTEKTLLERMEMQHINGLQVRDLFPDKFEDPSELGELLGHGFSVYMQLWYIYAMLNLHGFYHNDQKSNNIMISKKTTSHKYAPIPQTDMYLEINLGSSEWFFPTIIDLDTSFLLEPRASADEMHSLHEADHVAFMFENGINEVQSAITDKIKELNGLADGESDLAKQTGYRERVTGFQQAEIKLTLLSWMIHQLKPRADISHTDGFSGAIIGQKRMASEFKPLANLQTVCRQNMAILNSYHNMTATTMSELISSLDEGEMKSYLMAASTPTTLPWMADIVKMMVASVHLQPVVHTGGSLHQQRYLEMKKKYLSLKKLF